MGFAHVCIYVYNDCMSSTRWSLVVSETTDRALRTYLASRGLRKGALSQFIEEAVREKLFNLTVAEVKERNAGQADSVMQAVEEAIERADP